MSATGDGSASGHGGGSSGPRSGWGSGSLRPVSASLSIAPGPEFDVVREAMAEIDTVHGAGAMPTFTVQRGIDPLDRLGYFDPANNLIFVSDLAPNPKVVTWHETGHLLDFYGLGGPTNYASYADPVLDGWRDAMIASDAVRELWDAVRNRAGPMQIINLTTYWLDYPELWARSYSQYIATRTADQAMLRVLGSETYRINPAEVVRLNWSDHDFAAIAGVIDALLRSLRWIP